MFQQGGEHPPRSPGASGGKVMIVSSHRRDHIARSGRPALEIATSIYRCRRDHAVSTSQSLMVGSRRCDDSPVIEASRGPEGGSRTLSCGLGSMSPPVGRAGTRLPLLLGMAPTWVASVARSCGSSFVARARTATEAVRSKASARFCQQRARSPTTIPAMRPSVATKEELARTKRGSHCIWATLVRMWAVLTPVTCLPLLACGSSSGGNSGSNASFCPTLMEYDNHCHRTDACSQALVRDCSARASDYSAAYLAAATECYSAPYDCPDGSAAFASECLSAHLTSAPSTAAQEKIRTDLCAHCPGSTSALPPFCGPGGSLAVLLPWNDAIVEEIDQQCTGADAAPGRAADGGAVVDCTSAFLSCASKLIPKSPSACQASPDAGMVSAGPGPDSG